MKHVIIVGGGASGMMAAIFAADNGADVTLIERNNKLGRKLYITGKGRCNVTNHCTIEEFIKEVPRNGKFLYSALHFLSPDQMIGFLKENGCDVVVERGRRVFPASGKASDITKALEKRIKELCVTVSKEERVESLVIQESIIIGVKLCSGAIIYSNAVVMATGGLSYPQTGSTGDGYTFLNKAGHSIIDTQPGLCALYTKELWPASLMGLSLTNVVLSVYKTGRRIYHSLGELMFTHKGLSGPLVLEASSYINAGCIDEYNISIDMKPGLTTELLEKRLMKDIKNSPNVSCHSILAKLLPNRLAGIILGLSGVDVNKKACQISRSERQDIIQLVKGITLSICQHASFEEAIITRGGVSVKEIDVQTMESKIVRGLYIVGELIDVDAHTGGYNLQIAFSTGAAAGYHAAF